MNSQLHVPNLTLSVVEGVHVAADVALQVGMEARSRGEKGQADSHELPAPLQAVIAEILCGLTTQLDVELITQTLIAPPTHHNLRHRKTPEVRQMIVSGKGFNKVYYQ